MSFTAGDLCRVTRERAGCVVVPAGGFAAFLDAPPTPIRQRVPPVPADYGEYVPQARRHLTEPRHEPRPTGKYIPAEPEPYSPRTGGKVHIFPVSAVLKPAVAVIIPTKHRVRDPVRFAIDSEFCGRLSRVPCIVIC